MKFTGERVVPSDMHNNIDVYQQHLLRYTWALQFVNNKNVLDAACGAGYGSDLLSHVSKSVMGVDKDRDALRYARSHYPNLCFVYDDLDDPKFHDNMDVVVTFETVEHLEKPTDFLQWCKGQAKEVIGSIPIQCPTPYHKHVYSVYEILNMLRVFKRIELWSQKGLSIVKYFEGQEVLNGMLLFRGFR